MKYYKEELEKIRLDSTLLLEEIEKSHGYVLYEMERYKIEPPDISLFQKRYNGNNLNYIIKNYDLNPEIIEEIISMFDDFNENESIRLTDEQIKNYLKEGKLLPKNTTLSLDILLNYSLKNQKENSYISTIIKSSIKDL